MHHVSRFLLLCIGIAALLVAALLYVIVAEDDQMIAPPATSYVAQLYGAAAQDTRLAPADAARNTEAAR